jgi:hypothetical protein
MRSPLEPPGVDAMLPYFVIDDALGAVEQTCGLGGLPRDVFSAPWIRSFS